MTSITITRRGGRLYLRALGHAAGAPEACCGVSTLLLSLAAWAEGRRGTLAHIAPGDLRLTLRGRRAMLAAEPVLRGLERLARLYPEAVRVLTDADAAGGAGEAADGTSPTRRADRLPDAPDALRLFDAGEGEGSEAAAGEAADGTNPTRRADRRPKAAKTNPPAGHDVYAPTPSGRVPSRNYDAHIVPNRGTDAHAPTDAETKRPVGHDAHIVPKRGTDAHAPSDAETNRPVGHDAHIVPKRGTDAHAPTNAPTSRDRPVGHDAHIVPNPRPQAHEASTAGASGDAVRSDTAASQHTGEETVPADASDPGNPASKRHDVGIVPYGEGTDPADASDPAPADASAAVPAALLRYAAETAARQAAEAERARYAAEEAARREARARALAEAQSRRWALEAAALRARQPDFDLDAMRADPTFALLLTHGASLERAWRAATVEQRERAARAEVERALSADIRAHGLRPAEAGAGSDAVIDLRPDVRSLSDREVLDVLERLKRRERVSFG